MQEGTKSQNRDRIASLRRAYERGSIEGLCAVVYGADGSTRLFSKSTLYVSSTLAAVALLRGLPYWVDDPVSGLVIDEGSEFNPDFHLEPAPPSPVTAAPHWTDDYTPNDRVILLEHGLDPATDPRAREFNEHVIRLAELGVSGQQLHREAALAAFHILDCDETLEISAAALDGFPRPSRAVFISRG